MPRNPSRLEIDPRAFDDDSMEPLCRAYLRGSDPDIAFESFVRRWERWAVRAIVCGLCFWLGALAARSGWLS